MFYIKFTSCFQGCTAITAEFLCPFLVRNTLLTSVLNKQYGFHSFLLKQIWFLQIARFQLLSEYYKTASDTAHLLKAYLISRSWLSNSSEDFMCVKCKPPSYSNPLWLQPEIRIDMTKRRLSPKLSFGYDISTSPMPSGTQATAAHCKVFSGCCWESLGWPEQMNWSLNYTLV